MVSELFFLLRDSAHQEYYEMFGYITANDKTRNNKKNIII